MFTELVTPRALLVVFHVPRTSYQSVTLTMTEIPSRTVASFLVVPFDEAGRAGHVVLWPVPRPLFLTVVVTSDLYIY